MVGMIVFRYNFWQGSCLFFCPVREKTYIYL